jgi:hypothetical protein
MSQPEWECIGQLGDKNPLDHGGYWILRDKTGVYCEEGELLIEPSTEEHKEYTVYRFILDRCTFIDGVLSDNKYHPECCAWWATTPEKMAERPQDGKGLIDIADSSGISVEDLIEMFCSEDALRRAIAYRLVGNYHGFDNFDEDPMTMKRFALRNRYRGNQFKVKETPA